MTKVDRIQEEECEDSSIMNPQAVHYEHSLNAVRFIRNQMKMIHRDQIPTEKFVELPPSDHKKVLIFDMDETLIHCVDDIES